MITPYEVNLNNGIIVVRGYKAIAPGPETINGTDVTITKVETKPLRELNDIDERQMAVGDLKAFMQLHYYNIANGDNVTVIWFVISFN